VRGKGGRTGVDRGEKKREEDIKYPGTYRKKCRCPRDIK
jgi:hypothetical protein